jgi:hypothetical protein
MPAKAKRPAKKVTKAKAPARRPAAQKKARAKSPPAGSSYVEMAYASIRVFRDDTVDVGEINFLLGLALRDGRIDADERRVLQNVFDQINEKDVPPTVWRRIESVRRTHGI